MTRVGIVAAVALSLGLMVVAVPASVAGSSPHRSPWIVPERVPAASRPNVVGRLFAHLRGVREFPGMGPCEAGFCWTPGEPVIAVGPTDIVETVNTAATVYSKATGAQLAEFDFGTFWGAQTTECVDPRALYLAAADRFAFSCTDITNATSPMRFAISRTADPAGAWYTYAAPNTAFLDQDKIEATSDKFVIAGNSSSTEKIYVYNLSDVVAGSAHPAVRALTAKRSNVYQAVVEQSAASPAYFVSSYPGGKLYLATVTGTPAAANVALAETAIPGADYPAPQEPQVPGGAIGQGDLDGRVYDPVYEVETSDAKPVIQYSSARECGTRTCLTSARIDLSGSKPVLVSDVLVGEPGWDYSYGAVGLDAQGDVYEAYARSSSSTTPGAGVVGPGFDVSLQAPGAGTTACSSGQSAPCDERWGDYLGTAIDPANPNAVWVTGLYQVSSGGYGWGTVIARVSTTTFSLPSVTTGAATSIKATKATVSGRVDPNGVATTYHLDYGLTTGYDSATAEQSAGSGTSAVPVTATLTGLQPGLTYDYRVVATTSAGSAVGPNRTFKTPRPAITAVTFTGAGSNPTITITGKNFGTLPAANPPTTLNCVAGDTSFDYGSSGLWFSDGSQGWTAARPETASAWWSRPTPAQPSSTRSAPTIPTSAR
jgi:hypothetical protein